MSSYKSVLCCEGLRWNDILSEVIIVRLMVFMKIRVRKIPECSPESHFRGKHKTFFCDSVINFLVMAV